MGMLDVPIGVWVEEYLEKSTCSTIGSVWTQGGDWLPLTWEEKGTLENPSTKALAHRVYLRLRLKQENQESTALTTSNK